MDAVELGEPLLRSPRSARSAFGRVKRTALARAVWAVPAFVGLLLIARLLRPRDTSALPSLDALADLVTFGDSYTSTYAWPKPPLSTLGDPPPDRLRTFSIGRNWCQVVASSLKPVPLRHLKCARRDRQSGLTVQLRIRRSMSARRTPLRARERPGDGRDVPERVGYALAGARTHAHNDLVRVRRRSPARSDAAGSTTSRT